MFRKLAFPLFFLIAFLGNCQDSATYSLGADFNYHPQDFFFHVRGQISKKNLVQDVFIGVGVNKTIFQKQFRPSLGYDVGYNFRLTSWFSIKPYFRLTYSNLNTKVPVKHPFIHTAEGLFAGAFIFGKQNKFSLNAGIGPALEWKYDAYSGKRSRFFMWNYFIGLTYYYEL